MPGKVKVKILSGRNLPVMDRSNDTTDAYVEIKLGNTTYKTDVCRKSLNPKWNSEWYRFELDDAELQDEPLQIRLMDHDTYSANDAIGKVYLDLNPLLLPATSYLSRYGWKADGSTNSDSTSNSAVSGWFPVYDTMHGIRGEVSITVKIELFTDYNRFRQSSCGVQFFCSSSIPHGYYSQVVHGFVEELIVDDDPEYQWIDKIRTPRASNEARQTLFFKLSRELQRRIGVKALDLGGNCVIGYRQCFDLEGESGVVARGIGTAVTLVKIVDIQHSKIPEEVNEECNNTPPQDQQSTDQNHAVTETVGAKVSSPAKINNTLQGICRRSSDSDLSVTPKANSLTGSDRSGGQSVGHFMRPNAIIKGTLLQDNFEMLEYPFLTMSKYPAGFILHLGGAVSSRSVKLLERISNLEEPESRDHWWSELRMEIRSHARALNCNAVLGYSETASICEDVCVLSASGTAAMIGFHCFEEISDNFRGLHVTPKLHLGSKDIMTTSLDRNDFEKAKGIEEAHKIVKTVSESPEHDSQQTHFNSCSICHLPYNTNNVPVRSSVLKCSVCRIGKVPDIIIATIEMPDGLQSVGRGCFIQSFICRPLKDLRGESSAKEISDGLPFLEYELHRLLVNKLKIKGMNAIFGLKININVGEKMLTGIATGTACFLSALPTPAIPKLTSDRLADQKKLSELQKQLSEIVKRNRELYQLKDAEENIQNGVVPSDDEEDDVQSACELSLGNKDCCILEIDDPEDQEVLHMLMEGRPPDGFHIVNTEFVPGLQDLEIVNNLQMFTQIYRTKLHPPYSLDRYVHKLLQILYFKLRNMIPCALNIQFHVDIPEPDEIQLSVLGITLGLADSQRIKSKRRSLSTKKPDEELIFDLDDQVSENHVPPQPVRISSSIHSSLNRQKASVRSKSSVLKQRHMPYRERHGVDITPLSYVPGGKIERYLGNFSFFFIRETTSIREEGGINSFVHSFIMEVLAIVRAHVTALGGNAMVAYYMNKCVLNHSLHKNQGQCLINVGGDIVFVSYFNEES